MNIHNRNKDILENCDILILSKENNIPRKVYLIDNKKYVEYNVDMEEEK